MDEMVRRLERSEARRRSPARKGDDALRRRSVELVAPLPGGPRRAHHRALGAPDAHPLGVVHPGRRHDPDQRAAARRPGLGGRLRARARAGAPARTRPRRPRSGPGCTATRAPSGPWATWRGCPPPPGSGLVGIDGDDPGRRAGRSETGPDADERSSDRRRSSAIGQASSALGPGSSSRDRARSASCRRPMLRRPLGLRALSARIAFSSSAIGSPSSSRPTNAGRVVEVVGRRDQVRVRPQRVAPGDPALLAQQPPQLGGVAQLARPQLQPDDRGERLLGRAAGGAPPPQRLAQRRRPGQPLADRVGDHRVHPALDQREQRLQPGQRRLLLGRGLAARTCPTAWPPRSRRGSTGRCRGPAPRSARCRRVMPRAYSSTVPSSRSRSHADVREQPLVRRLPGGQVDHHLAGGPVEARRELLDVLRQQRGRPGPARPGTPMSVEVSTSAASWASPLPSWLPNARPPIWPSIASIGPAAARTSSGIASTQAPDTRWATGSHSRFQVGRLAVDPLARRPRRRSRWPRPGTSVAGSSHSSASLTASLHGGPLRAGQRRGGGRQALLGDAAPPGRS